MGAERAQSGRRAGAERALMGAEWAHGGCRGCMQWRAEGLRRGRREGVERRATECPSETPLMQWQQAATLCVGGCNPTRRAGA